MTGRPWTCAGCGGKWSPARRPALILGAPGLLRLCPDCAAKPRTVASAARRSGGLTDTATTRRPRILTRAYFRARL